MVLVVLCLCQASSPATEPATPTSAPPEEPSDLLSQLESTPHGELVGLMVKQRQTTLRYKTRFHEVRRPRFGTRMNHISHVEI